jgi:glycerol kinase
VRVERPVITETTALGAGMLAALGGGLVGSLHEAAGLWRLQRGFDPAMSASVREALLLGWTHAVARTLGHAVP